jgi:Zn-dependent peptidase ImmA (M78 family)
MNIISYSFIPVNKNLKGIFFMNINLLEKYCDENDIIAVTYEKIAELSGKSNFNLRKGEKGIAISHDDLNVIAYDGNLPNGEKYHVFAHEIGHHVMQHLTTRKQQRTAEEVEADVFASVLMALSVFSEMRGAVMV